ncbi:hypothetical protein B0T20DRAFT_393547 [Sordaria brevicollis]|uniref:Uncharacterized protein n=1 Tax=Sordaria brevicollis TaxID=83679 RepID=A0AAE0PD45_SORBR|nr:hypothetical protein B0T20DRAFT_393547 [Sordaria brevicollis]
MDQYFIIPGLGYYDMSSPISFKFLPLHSWLKLKVSVNAREKERFGEKEQGKKTYNTRDSLVVTDPTTSLALTGLSMGERTGSRVFQWVWSIVEMVFTLKEIPSGRRLKALMKDVHRESQQRAKQNMNLESIYKGETSIVVCLFQPTLEGTPWGRMMSSIIESVDMLCVTFPRTLICTSPVAAPRDAKDKTIGGDDRLQRGGRSDCCDEQG